MENANNLEAPVTQTSPSLPTKQTLNITLKEILIVLLLMIIVGGAGYVLGSKKEGVLIPNKADVTPTTTRAILTPTQLLLETPTITPQITTVVETPTARPTNIVVTPTATPTVEPTPTVVIDEIGLIRALIANFEKYNGAQNAAGALGYFTPPSTKANKDRLEYLRNKNIPYKLKSALYPINDDAIIFENKIPNGYAIYLNETRETTTDLMVFEVVRVNNDFLIDKYFQSNSFLSGTVAPDSLKYQGFSY